jgi:phage terminase large subunit
MDLDIELLPMQEEFVFSKAKFPAFVGGFGSGKTEALVNRAIIGKLQYPGLDRGYFAPTWDLIKLIAWPRFEELCDKYQIKAKLNQGERILRFHNGGSIIFRSLEVPQRIIGFEIADADIDELDTLPPAKSALAFQKVIARCRQRKPGGKPNTASVGTTPEGYRFVYERWQQKTSPMYQIYRAKTSDNPMLPDDYIDSLRETYPPQLLAAYIDGEFVNMTSGSVYPDFNRVLNGSKETMQAGEPLHIGVDFNIMNMSAIVNVIREDRPIAVAEHLRMRDTESMARHLAEAYPNRSISVYPDASGSQRQHGNVGTTDLAILGAKGFRICVNGTNGPVRDRVNAVNAMILNAKGDRRFKINVEKCPVTTNNLEQQAYDQNGVPEKKSGSNGTDHSNDALGYFLNYKWPIVRPVSGVINIGFAN